MNRLILSVSLFIVLSCESPSLPLISSIDYNIEWMSGSTRDILIFKDTLFVANESEGIIMYNLDQEAGRVESIEKIWDNTSFSQSQKKSFRRVDFDTSRKVLYGVDNFDYTYFIDFLNLTQDNNLIDSPEIVLCTGATNNVTRIELLNNYNETGKSEYIALFKNNGSSGSWSKISKMEISFEVNPYVESLYTPSFSCDDSNQIENLSYNVTDIDLMYDQDNDATLVGISNSSFTDYRSEIYSLKNGQFSYLDATFFSKKPNTIKFFKNHNESISVAVGLSDGGGCYIELLDVDGKIIENSNRLHLADGYSVLDVEVADEEILLSLGINGVQVYSLDGVFIKGIVSGHAYCSSKYGNSYIIGTKNGVEVFN